MDRLVGPVEGVLVFVHCAEETSRECTLDHLTLGPGREGDKDDVFIFSWRATTGHPDTSDDSDDTSGSERSCTPPAGATRDHSVVLASAP